MKLNGALIPAKEGTKGEGAIRSLRFDVRRLQGSSPVGIEVFRLDGRARRSGPASLFKWRERSS